MHILSQLPIDVQQNKVFVNSNDIDFSLGPQHVYSVENFHTFNGDQSKGSELKQGKE